MVKRKTFDVDQFRIRINNMLAESAEDERQGRFVMASVLEGVLMDTGNYVGFRYTDGMDGAQDASRRSYY